jgi:hypothetical protein
MLNKKDYMGIFEDFSKWENLNKQFDEGPHKPGIKQRISQELFKNPLALNNAPLDVVSMYTIEQKNKKTSTLMDTTEENLESLVNTLTIDITKPEMAAGFALSLPYFESENYSDLTKIHKEFKKSKEVLKNKDLDSAVKELKEEYGVDEAVVYHAQFNPDSLFGIYEGIIQTNAQNMVQEFTNKDKFKKNKFKDYLSHLASNTEEASKYEVLKNIAGGSYQILKEASDKKINN